MNEPTKKLWHVGMRGGFNACLVYDRSGNLPHEDAAICQVYGLPQNTTIEEIMANPRYEAALRIARMIAASPEMRAALELIAGGYLPDHIEMTREDMQRIAAEAIAPNP